MTYKYGETDQGDCLYNTARAYPGGIEALAHRMGVNAGTLQKKLSPMIKSYIASDEDATVVMELCHSAGVPDSFAAHHARSYRLGFICVPVPNIENGDISDKELQRLVMASVAQLGEAVAASTDALLDGHISEQEVERIEPRIRALMRTAHMLIHGMRARAKSDASKLINKFRRQKEAA